MSTQPNNGEGAVKNAAKVGVESINADATVEKIQSQSDQENLTEFGQEKKDNFIRALKEDKMPFVPVASEKNGIGYADTNPTYKARKGRAEGAYKETFLLETKVHRKENGFKSDGYISDEMAAELYSKYCEANGIENDFKVVVPGAKCIVISMPQKDGDIRYFNMYNLDQLVHKDGVVKQARIEQKEFEKKRNEERKAKGYSEFVANDKWAERRADGKLNYRTTVECRSADPVEYMAKYEFAVSTGNLFSATPEIYQKFKENTIEMLNKGQSQYQKLSNLSNLMQMVSKRMHSLEEQERRETAKKFQSPAPERKSPQPEMGR